MRYPIGAPSKPWTERTMALSATHGINCFSPNSRRCFFFLFTNFFSSSCARLMVEESSSSSNTGNYLELPRRQMRDFAASGELGRALQTFKFIRDELDTTTLRDYHGLISSYFKSTRVDMDGLVKLYEELKSFAPPDAKTYRILLNGMLSLGCLKDAILLTHEMRSNGFAPKFGFLKRLLGKSIDSGCLISSVDALGLILTLDFMPTVRSVYSLISTVTEVGRYQEALGILSTLLAKGYFCSAYIFNPLVWALCKSGQSCAALQILHLMKRKGIVPDVCSYTALIYGFTEEGLYKEADRCLDDMRRDEGKQPNARTYTVIVKSLCDDGKVDEALSLLAQMENEGCHPDLYLYNILIRELCLRDRINDLSQVFQDLSQKGLVPDCYTFSAVLGLLKIGRVEMAYSLSSYLISQDCPMDVVVYNMFLHSLCQDSKTNEAFSLLEFMTDKGCIPNNVSYNIVLNGLCNEDRLDEALESLGKVEWAGNGPDVISFNTILSAACKQGNSSMIRRVLYRMEYKGIKLDVVSSTCLMQYFWDVAESFELLKLMMTNGPSPSTVSINVFLHQLCKVRLLRIARKVLDCVRSYGIVPDITTYNILVNASLGEGDDSLVGQIIWEMYSQNLRLDIVTYRTIISALCRRGEIRAAKQLSLEMPEKGLSPGMAVYIWLFEAMLQREEFRDAVALLKQMALEGCEPSEVRQEILNRANSKGGTKEVRKMAKRLKFVIGIF